MARTRSSRDRSVEPASPFGEWAFATPAGAAPAAAAAAAEPVRLAVAQTADCPRLIARRHSAAAPTPSAATSPAAESAAAQRLQFEIACSHLDHVVELRFQLVDLVLHAFHLL